MKRLDRAIVSALEETRLPWAVEDGKKHRKLRLAGYLVGILPTVSNGDQRRFAHATDNVIAQIRRKAREIRSNPPPAQR